MRNSPPELPDAARKSALGSAAASPPRVPKTPPGALFLKTRRPSSAGLSAVLGNKAPGGVFGTRGAPAASRGAPAEPALARGGDESLPAAWDWRYNRWAGRAPVR